MTKPLSFSDVPHNWPICFQNECPLSAHCLRRRVAELAPEGLMYHACVLPAAHVGETCRLYVEAQPVGMAHGMTRLFADVKPWDLQALRHSIIGIFGSRAQFYRYRDGRYDITPEQQARVAAAFRHHGYTQPPVFDSMTEQYYFPACGNASPEPAADGFLTSETAPSHQ